MKKIIIITLCIMSIATMAYADIYPTTMIVVELDNQHDIVICEDFNGNQWAFEGIEDWMIGDIVSMIMEDMGTAQIYDDIIVMTQYSGYMEGF